MTPNDFYSVSFVGLLIREKKESLFKLSCLLAPVLLDRLSGSCGSQRLNPSAPHFLACASMQQREGGWGQPGRPPSPSQVPPHYVPTHLANTHSSLGTRPFWATCVRRPVLNGHHMSAALWHPSYLLVSSPPPPPTAGHRASLSQSSEPAWVHIRM